MIENPAASRPTQGMTLPNRAPSARHTEIEGSGTNTTTALHGKGAAETVWTPPASLNTNPYTYANDNPLTGIDPSGHDQESDGGEGEADGESNGSGRGGTAVLTPEVVRIFQTQADVDTEFGKIIAASFESVSSGSGNLSASEFGTMENVISSLDDIDPQTGESRATEILQLPVGASRDAALQNILMFAEEGGGGARRGLNDAYPGAGDNGDYCHGMSCLELLFGGLSGDPGSGDGSCVGPDCFGPPPPPPPAWAVNHKRPDPTCTGGCVTKGTPNLATTVQPGSAYVPSTAADQGSQLSQAQWFASDEWIFLSQQQIQTNSADENGCMFSSSTWMAFGQLDKEGRATGAMACLTGWSVNYAGRGKTIPVNPGALYIGGDTQHGANAVDPPGFRRGMQRGHLIGRQLGGPGNLEENLIPIYANANDPGMENFESDVAGALRGGQRIYYSVIPIYDGADPIPASIDMYAVGSGGLSLAENVPNLP